MKTLLKMITILLLVGLWYCPSLAQSETSPGDTESKNPTLQKEKKDKAQLKKQQRKKDRKAKIQRQSQVRKRLRRDRALDRRQVKRRMDRGFAQRGRFGRGRDDFSGTGRGGRSGGGQWSARLGRGRLPEAARAQGRRGNRWGQVGRNRMGFRGRRQNPGADWDRGWRRSGQGPPPWAGMGPQEKGRGRAGWYRGQQRNGYGPPAWAGMARTGRQQRGPGWNGRMRGQGWAQRPGRKGPGSEWEPQGPRRGQRGLRGEPGWNHGQALDRELWGPPPGAGRGWGRDRQPGPRRNRDYQPMLQDNWGPPPLDVKEPPAG
ncbi:MAG: hypothetical protein JW860_12840 [Sedimentisphaerales bacterium]|nr:hypothetical protein [Sedimentisphaerales bacterium]